MKAIEVEIQVVKDIETIVYATFSPLLPVIAEVGLRTVVFTMNEQ